MDAAAEREIIQLLSSYISQTDQMRRQATGGSVFGGATAGLGKINAMNTFINMNAAALFRILPSMNFAELTAFSELVSSHLAQVRMVRAFNE